jgi:hypothetical protein
VTYRSGSLHCNAASTKLLKGGSITRLLIFITADVAVSRNLAFVAGVVKKNNDVKDDRFDRAARLGRVFPAVPPSAEFLEALFSPGEGFAHLAGSETSARGNSCLLNFTDRSDARFFAGYGAIRRSRGDTWWLETFSPPLSSRCRAATRQSHSGRQLSIDGRT